MGQSSRAGSKDIRISDFIQSMQQIKSDDSNHKKEMEAADLAQRKIEVEKSKAVLEN